MVRTKPDGVHEFRSLISQIATRTGNSLPRRRITELPPVIKGAHCKITESAYKMERKMLRKETY